MVLMSFARTKDSLCIIEKIYRMVIARATDVVNLFDSIAQKEMTEGIAARHAEGLRSCAADISGECFDTTKS